MVARLFYELQKMKSKFFCFSAIFLLLTSLVFTSCHETCVIDPVQPVEGSTTFLGKVSVSPSNIKNGEQVTLSIEDFDISSSASIGISTEFNGKNIVKSVSYYIDGEKIAESSDKDNRYSVKYVVNNLSAGTHKVTAHCTSNFEHYTIKEIITSATLQVEE